jgi:hypothetical protein
MQDPSFTPNPIRSPRHSTQKEISPTIRSYIKRQTLAPTILTEELHFDSNFPRYLTPTLLLTTEPSSPTALSPDFTKHSSILKLLQLKNTTKIKPRFRQLELIGKKFLSPHLPPSQLKIIEKNVLETNFEAKKKKEKKNIKKITIPSHFVKSTSWKVLPKIVKKKVSGQQNVKTSPGKIGRGEKNGEIEIPGIGIEKESFSLNGWEQD